MIAAATNEALRQVESESAAVMSKLTGALAVLAEVFLSDGILQQPYQ